MKWAGWFLLVTWITWVYYLGCTPLYRAYKDGTLAQLSPWTLLLAYLTVGGFVVVDFAFNLVACPVIYLALPRNWLFTQSCDRYLTDQGFRGKRARWFCHNMLDPFDPRGKHCND